MDNENPYESVIAGLSALTLVANSIVRDQTLSSTLISPSTVVTLPSSSSSPPSSSPLFSSTSNSCLPLRITNTEEIGKVLEGLDKYTHTSLSAALHIALHQQWSPFKSTSSVSSSVTETESWKAAPSSSSVVVPNSTIPKDRSEVSSDYPPCGPSATQTIDRSSISTAEYLRLCRLSSLSSSSVVDTETIEKIFDGSVLSLSTPSSASASVGLYPNTIPGTTILPSPSDSETEDPVPTCNENGLEKNTIQAYFTKNKDNHNHNQYNHTDPPYLWARTRINSAPSTEAVSDLSTVESGIQVSILVIRGYAIAIIDCTDEFVPYPSALRYATVSPFPATVTIETLPFQTTAQSSSELVHDLPSLVKISANIHKGNYPFPSLQPIESKMDTKYTVNYSHLVSSYIQFGVHKVNANTNHDQSGNRDPFVSDIQLNLDALTTKPLTNSRVILHRRYLLPLMNEGHTLCFVLPTILSQLRNVQIQIYNMDPNFQGIHNIICPSHTLRYTSSEPSTTYTNLVLRSIDQCSSSIDTTKKKTTNFLCSFTYDRGYLPLVLLIEPKNIGYQWQTLSPNPSTLPTGFVSVIRWIHDQTFRSLHPSSSGTPSASPAVGLLPLSTVVSSIVPSSTTFVETDSSITLSSKALPRHIAVVMDGNGRWAQSRGLKRSAGHRAGVNTIHELIRSCRRLRIPYLTLYAFSAQNWTRPEEEVRILMTLLAEFVATDLQELCANGVRLVVNGDINKLPSPARTGLLRMISASRYNTGLTLCLALSYGGREEIVGGVTAACRAAVAGLLDPNTLTPETFRNFLPHSDIPDPDLLIRTSGELRVSNFLLWQIAYTELYVTSTLWPDFDETELTKALLSYANRERRFGKTSAQVQDENTITPKRSNSTVSKDDHALSLDKKETIAMMEQMVSSITAMDTLTTNIATTVNRLTEEQEEEKRKETEENFVTLYQRSDNDRSTTDNGKSKDKLSIWSMLLRWYTMVTYYVLGTTLHDAFYQMLNSDEVGENTRYTPNNSVSSTSSSGVSTRTTVSASSSSSLVDDQVLLQHHQKLHQQSIRQRLSLAFLIGLVVSLSIFAFIIMRKVTIDTWSPPVSSLSNAASSSFSAASSSSSLSHTEKDDSLMLSTLYMDELEYDYRLYHPGIGSKLSLLSGTEEETKETVVFTTGETSDTLTWNVEGCSRRTEDGVCGETTEKLKSKSPWPWPATAHPPKVDKGNRISSVKD